MSFVPYADNVLIRLEPLGYMTESDLQVVEFSRAGARKLREAKVIASGKGYYRRRRSAAGSTLGEYTEPTGIFVPNETKAGDTVLVDALAGDAWEMNINVPRHNKGTSFLELFGEPGEYRVVREDEIEATIERS